MIKKIIGVVPARGGSKGIKEKNIKSLQGLPLINYTLNVGRKTNLDRLIVSTDSSKIKSIVEKNNVNVPFIRPANLSGDNSSSIDVAIHALESMEKIDGVKYDAVMLLQPTTPFRSVEDINSAIKLLNDNKDADSVISVVDVGATHPARMKYFEDGFLIDPPFCEEKENQNRQELDKMYIRNGAIYLTKRETLLSRSFKGENCLGLEMPIERSVNIDTMDDFRYAEFILGVDKDD